MTYLNTSRDTIEIPYSAEAALVFPPHVETVVHFPTGLQGFLVKEIARRPSLKQVGAK